MSSEPVIGDYFVILELNTMLSGFVL